MASGSKAKAKDVRARLAELRKEWGWTPSELVNLLKGGGSSSKGSAYERDVCRQLSMWWTNGDREDVFWRSSGSGARAKVRGKAGKATAGQHGDIAATDPIGEKLIDVLTLELKRGYDRATFQDLLDRPGTAAAQQWEGFLAQTIESWEMAGSYAWGLVARRDRREAMLWLPWYVFADLRAVGAKVPTPLVRCAVEVRPYGRVELAGMKFADFLTHVEPQQLKKLEV